MLYSKHLHPTEIYFVKQCTFLGPKTLTVEATSAEELKQLEILALKYSLAKDTEEPRLIHGALGSFYTRQGMV